jgi:hypothetical protein
MASLEENRQRMYLPSESGEAINEPGFSINAPACLLAVFDQFQPPRIISEESHFAQSKLKKQHKSVFVYSQ